MVEALELKVGEQVTIPVDGERSFAVEKSAGAAERLARLRKFRGRLPTDFKFDRIAANERG